MLKAHHPQTKVCRLSGCSDEGIGSASAAQQSQAAFKRKWCVRAIVYMSSTRL